MRRRGAVLRVIALLGLGVVASSSCAPPTPRAAGGGSDDIQVNIALPVVELHLANGLHVVLHEERSSSLALVHVRYHVGSKDDPQGRSGFAHLYEHLMFRGSRNTGAKDYTEWVEESGGSSNAYTTRDSTDYHVEVPASALPRAIWLEADRMAYPLSVLAESGFAHERDVVKNEWRQHYEDVPLGNLEAIARDAIFGGDHPYGTSTIGSGGDLEKITLAEARAFGGLYYRPNNATLVVCGVFDVAATRELVTRYFGSIPPGAPQPSRVFPPLVPRSQKIKVAAAVDGPAVSLAWPAPATHGDGFEELRYAVESLESHVRSRFVMDLKIANDVDTMYDHGRLGGLVTITVTLKRGASTSTALSELDDTLADASKQWRQATWDSFGSLKTQALVAQIGELEGLEGRARRILHDVELHGGPGFVQKDLRRLQSVGAADVGGAVDHFLIAGPRVTMVVTPDASAPRAGRRVAP